MTTNQPAVEQATTLPNGMVVDTATGEVLSGYQDDVDCDLQTWRLRQKVTLLVSGAFRIERPNLDEPHNPILLKHLSCIETDYLPNALTQGGLIPKVVAAWPNTWFDRLCAIVERGCRPEDLPKRMRLLQEVVVAEITGGKAHDQYGMVGDGARRSQALYDHLVDLLQAQRNRGELAYTVMCLLDCAARADGGKFWRSVRQVADDSGGVLDAKHVGRYLERIAANYVDGKCILPIFNASKHKPGSRLATVFTINPEFRYLLDLI